MNVQRRQALRAGGALGLWGMLVTAGVMSPGVAQARERAIFDTETPAEAYRALGLDSAPQMSEQIELVAPDIAENGAVVPIGVISEVPGTEKITLLVSNNPNMAAARFAIPAGTLPEVQTRLKMSETSNVIAVVEAEGRFYMTRKEVRVTIGGCG